MQYALALKSNYPIGSGVTEATCKTLVTQRMKCAGMRWNINGGQGVLTARSSEIVNVVVASTVKTYAAFLFRIIPFLVLPSMASALSGVRWTT